MLIVFLSLDFQPKVIANFPLKNDFFIEQFLSLSKVCRTITQKYYFTPCSFLSTGGEYYVPYSFLFISNKFCNGGERPKQGD
jgi:hypothetical protein